MSYPPPPPNNPYEGGNPYQQPPPQQQQQQGYGYPQQPGQGQPGYGYPQQAGFQQPVQGGFPQQPGFNYPNAPLRMPGTVNAVRIIMFIMGGLGILSAIGNFYNATQVEETLGGTGLAGFGAGAMIASGVISLLLAATAIFLASQFNKGGNGIRIGSIIYGSVLAFFGLLALIVVVGIIPLALGILIIVFMAKQDGAQWFNRARY